MNSPGFASIHVSEFFIGHEHSQSKASDVLEAVRSSRLSTSPFFTSRSACGLSLELLATFPQATWLRQAPGDFVMHLSNGSWQVCVYVSKPVLVSMGTSFSVDRKSCKSEIKCRPALVQTSERRSSRCQQRGESR